MKILDKIAQDGGGQFEGDLTLPLVPLKDMVLMPYLAMPLYIGRKFSIEAVEEALSRDKLIYFVAQKDEDQETPDNLDIYSVGTIGEVVHIIKLEDGKLKVLV